MRFPQLLVYETDGRLAALLRELAEGRQWSLREPRQPAACLRLLRRGGPSVLVLKLGAALGQRTEDRGQRTEDRGQRTEGKERARVGEWALLERVGWHCPETATVVVGDAEHAALAGVAWDLGAAYVLFPPWPRDWLPDIVAGLMAEDRGQRTEDRSQESGVRGQPP